MWIMASDFVSSTKDEDPYGLYSAVCSFLRRNIFSDKNPPLHFAYESADLVLMALS